jgi:hypothetical protein
MSVPLAKKGTADMRYIGSSAQWFIGSLVHMGNREERSREEALEKAASGLHYRRLETTGLHSGRVDWLFGVVVQCFNEQWRLFQKNLYFSVSPRQSIVS